MKKYISILAIMVLAVLVLSCEESAPQKERVEMRFSSRISSVATETKASFPQVNTQFLSGDKVSVWIDEVDDEVTPLYENVALTADGNGGLYGNETLYYPFNEKRVNVYSLHSNAVLTTSYPTAYITHEVESLQKDINSFVKSDLSYARRADVVNGTEQIALTYYHLLSKIQVALVIGEGLVDSDIIAIEIGGTKLGATFLLEKSVEPTEISVSATGTVSNIEVGNDVSTSFYKPQYNDAIIVPQTILKDIPFIIVTLSEGVRLAYTLPEEVTFRGQTCYQYHIGITKNEISVTSKVVDWISGGVVTGSADIEVL